MADPKLQVELGINLKKFEDGLRKSAKDLKKFGEKIKVTGEKFQQTGLTMTKTLTAPLAILAGLAVKTAADFETLNTSLKTTFKGNEKAAKAAFKQIIKFASSTPFQVEQVTNAFIKLKNYGLDPSEKALTAYGDTASAMGKSLDQMVEAVADAATGEFERLKEFGIKASKQGEDVAFTFRGVTTTVKSETEAIQGYLINLGETEFAGGMAEQSKTFSGRLSTLKDNVSLLSNEFGIILIEYLNPLVDAVGRLAKRFQSLSPATKKVIVIVASLVAAIGPLLIALGFMMTTVVPGLIAAYGVLATTIIPAVIAGFVKLNAVMLANPIVAVVAGFVALSYAAISLLQSLTPIVSKMQTFFNVLKSGGDYARFVNLQMEDIGAAIMEEGKAADIAKKAQEDLNAQLAKTVKLAVPLVSAAGVISGSNRTIAKGVTGQQIGGGEIKTDKDDIVKGNPIGYIDEKAQEIENRLATFRDNASQIVNVGVVDAFSGIGEAIGGALAKGDDVMKALGDTLLSSIGSILVQLGKAAIAAGVGMIAIKKAFTNPVTAIAAGIALTVLGSAIGGMVSGATSGIGSGDASGGSGGSGSSSFSGSSTTTSSVGQSGGTYVFEIQGSKLVGVLKNTLARNKAFGGNIVIG